MSHTNELHHLSYLANNRPTEAAKRYAELLGELLEDQSETGRRVVSANDAAQPLVRRRNHTTYVPTDHQTNERQDTAPKDSFSPGSAA